MPSSTVASSDFGLYLDKKPSRIKLKLVLVLICSLLLCFGILFALVHLVSEDQPPIILEDTLENPIVEKLVFSESVKRETQHLPPKPFGVNYKGQPPAQFTSSTTERITTLSYPYQKSFHFPSSIQDLIGHGNPMLHPQHSMKQYYQPKEVPIRNFSENDPFHSYKPQDPSDVNLLATGNVRFAPPVWSNLHHRPSFHAQHQETTNRKEIYNVQHYQQQHRIAGGALIKPITLTLNIYPNNDSGEPEQKIGLKQVVQQKLERFQNHLRLPIGGGSKPKKMVVRLNLYPDSFVTGIHRSSSV